MGQKMNDFLESDTPFSFQQLLYGDDWQRGDTYPSVDVNANLLHPTVEMNHASPISLIHPMEETFEQWLQTFANEPFERVLLLIIEQIGDVFNGFDIDGNLDRRMYEDRSGKGERCVLCLDEFKCNDEASKLACGHDYHFKCIKNWLMVKNKCPLCNQQAL